MKHSTLIVAAIVPLAVFASVSPKTTIGPISGSGQPTVSEGIRLDSFAVRNRAKSVDRRTLSKRAYSIRPRTNRLGFTGDGPPAPES
jgi:hypothetical protein